MKKVVSIFVAMLMAFTLAGCGGGSTSTKSNEGDLSGKISLNGSTSMQKFVTALGESFKEKYPNVNVEAQFTGSSAGIAALQKGTCDIADSSRALSDDEKNSGLIENVVAIDGIAVSINKANKVKSLTKQQLADIYTGKITNWKDVG
ncbi:MAG TPA: phosphate ABC transporter substrate-binding protein, partial [Erysipelotrichaceae bacterium]|nr:phosphate ABC transporter substrate-binding protein [Erysipelotrichaceae bacterium]